MVKRLEGIGLAVGIFFLYMLGQLAMTLPGVVSGIALPIAFLLSLLVFIFWIGWGKKLLGLSFDPIKSCLPWFFLSYGLIFTNNILGALILDMQGLADTDNQALLNEMMNRIPGVIMFLEVVLLAPLAEELICRGIIPCLVFKGYEKWGYLLGGFLFALLHSPSNLGSWVIYGGMSAILTCLAYKSKSLEVPLTLHVLNNAVAFLLFQVM